MFMHLLHEKNDFDEMGLRMARDERTVVEAAADGLY